MSNEVIEDRKDKQVHKNHRERLRNRFLKEGLDNFDELYVLELLLFYCIPRRDTNPIAHDLLERFGSLAQVMDAPVSELEKIDGIGTNAAMFLNLIPAVGRYYQINKSSNVTSLNTTEKCGDYLINRFWNLRNETVFLLCLDAKCKLLQCREVGEGSVNCTEVSVRKIVEAALAENATSVVLSHNHPSGLALPSAEDVLTTKRVAAALDTVGITLADHIIVADDDYVSLVQSGLYNPDETHMLTI